MFGIVGDSEDRKVRIRHLDALRRVLDYDLPEKTREAFEGMLAKLTEEVLMQPGEVRHVKPGQDGAIYWEWCLTKRQARWVYEELEKWEPPVVRLTGGPIPRGREVELPPVLRVLPLKPPGRV